MKTLSRVVLALSLFAAASFAQTVAGMGGISGTVRDASGSVVAGAQVTVSNDDKGIKRSIISNEAGVFTAPALVPSTGYAVAVEKQGFKKWEAKNIELLVGQNISLNVSIDVGSATTIVDVIDTAPIVESTKTGVSQVVESAQIVNLPINGRRVDSFVLLTPAVVSDGTFGLISFRGVAANNTFLTDGNDTTQSFFNENAGRTRISSQISQDAVQEFQVLSNNYSAEYGRASGGVVNTVTRSGSNDIHGAGYWFFRNQDFNSPDRYAPVNANGVGRLNPPEKRHQFGGSIGGPIKENKLFYFFNTEITRRDFPFVSTYTRAGFFDQGKYVGTSSTFGCLAPATQAQCDAAVGYIARHHQVVPRTANQELGFGKMDWRPTDAHTISLSLNYSRWLSPNGIQTQAVLSSGSGIGNNGKSTVRTRNGRASWTAILNPSTVNELRFGWFKDRQVDEHSPALVPVQTGYIQVNVGSTDSLGSSDILPRTNPSENRYQLADNLTKTIGKHTLKIGVDYSNTQDYYKQLLNGFGTYNYSTFTNFALDFSGNGGAARRWNTFSQRFGDPVIDTTIQEIALYVQNQFRATKALTVNLGLRYDYTVLPTPDVVNPDYPQTGRIPSATKNFAPRIGLAYSFNHDKTIIRTGFGIFHARYAGGLVNNTFFGNNGIRQKLITLNASVPADLALGPVFPVGLTGLDRNPPAGTVDISFADPTFRTPYTEQGDFGIEHAITKNLGVTVSYIWSRGLHNGTVRDLNIGPVGANTVSYRINDVSGNQVGTYTTPVYLLANRVDSRYRRVGHVESNGNSYYNALAVQVRKRVTHGLEGSLSYTWSHAIDYNQPDGRNNVFFSGAPRSLVNGDYKADKSSSSLDQRHRMTVSFVYAPTFVKSNGAVAKYLLNNWQLSQISTFASTQPQTPTVTVSGSAFTGAAFTGSLNGFGGSSRVPFLPAASIDVDQIVRTDARLTKVIPIREKMTAAFSFEVFNVFNWISNTAVNGTAYRLVSGALNVEPGLGLGSASQGFPDGTNARRAQINARFTF